MLQERLSSPGEGQPLGGTADRVWSGSWVIDDEADEADMEQRMLDKQLAMADVVLAERCGGTLPPSATVLQSQQLITKGEEEDEVSTRGAQCTRHQLVNDVVETVVSTIFLPNRNRD